MWTALALLLPLAVVPQGVDPAPAGARTLAVTPAGLTLDGAAVDPAAKGLHLPALHAALGQPRAPVVIAADPTLPFKRLVPVAYTLGQAGHTDLYFAVRGPAGPAVLHSPLPRLAAADDDPDCGAECLQIHSVVRPGQAHLWIQRGSDGYRVERADPARRVEPSPALKALLGPPGQGLRDGFGPAHPVPAPLGSAPPAAPASRALPRPPPPEDWCIAAPTAGAELSRRLAQALTLDKPCRGALLGAAEHTPWGDVALTFAALRAAKRRVALVVTDGPPRCAAPRWGQKSDQTR